MKPLSRIAAWFYDYPDFNVTEQELALLLAVKDGTVRKSDLGPKLRASPDDVTTLIEKLRQKRLLAPCRPNRVAVAGPHLAVSFDLSDPEDVGLSVPGRKLLRHTARSRR